MPEARPRIRYYVVKNGNGFWQPNKRMMHVGFACVACGPDGSEARAVAEAWNAKWDAHRSKAAPAARQADEPQHFMARGYVYFLVVRDRMKIGFSKAPWQRIDELKTGIGSAIDTFAFVRATRTDERDLHRALRSYRAAREWFHVSAEVKRTMMRCLLWGSVSEALSANNPETDLGTGIRNGDAA